MQPRWPIQLLVHIGDALAVAAAIAVARGFWLVSAPDVVGDTYLRLLFGSPHMPPGFLLMLFWWVALRMEGLYDPLRMISSLRIVQGIARAFVTVLVGAILVQYFTSHRVAFSRTLLLSFVVSSTVLLALWRVVFFRLQGWLTAGLLAREGVLIVGVGEDAKLMSERLGRYGAHVYDLRGFLVPAAPEPQVVAGPVLGTLGGLRRIVDEHAVGLVILASRAVSRDEAVTLTTHCAHMGLEVLQVPFTWGLAPVRVESAAVGELELVRLGGLSYPTIAEYVKRVFDLVAVILGGALLLPFLLGVAVAIKIEDGGPIFYASDRFGRGGRRFRFYKFRSMVVNADKIRGQLKNEADGRLFKMAKDPRITRIGHFIRKWSVDEFPQLLNVLLGDMNLVGPRPLPIQDLADVDADPEHRYWFEQRGRVKPGITGLWQVEGRSDLSFSRMVELDVFYIQHWSLLLDLQILARTIPAVLRGRGAR